MHFLTGLLIRRYSGYCKNQSTIAALCSRVLVEPRPSLADGIRIYLLQLSRKNLRRESRQVRAIIMAVRMKPCMRPQKMEPSARE